MTATIAMSANLAARQFAVATEGIDSSPMTPMELRRFVVWAEIQIQLGCFRHQRVGKPCGDMVQFMRLY